MMMESFVAPISIPSKIAKKKQKVEQLTEIVSPSAPPDLSPPPEPETQVGSSITVPPAPDPASNGTKKDKEPDLLNVSAKRVASFPLKAQSELSYLDSLIGGTKKVDYKAPKECVCCSAKGFHPGSFGPCVGDEAATAAPEKNIIVSLLSDSKKVCAPCTGIGRAYEFKTMEVLIPKNVKTGTKELYRVDSQGKQVPLNALIGQEIMVEFVVKAHPLFSKDEEGNAFYTCKVTPFQAMLGATVKAPSLMLPGTTVDINVPPGVQPGDVTRITNQGYTKPNCKKKRGDLVVTFAIEIPDLSKLTQEELEFYKYLSRWKSFPRNATLMVKGSGP